MNSRPRAFARPIIFALLTVLAAFTLPELRSVRAQDSNLIAYFGRTVAGVGDNVLVGAPDNYSAPFYGAAYLFDNNGNLLTSLHGQSDWGGFGGSVTVFGNSILVGAPFTTWAGKFWCGGNIHLRHHGKPSPNTSSIHDSGSTATVHRVRLYLRSRIAGLQ
ncbi:MAG: hypothetical protein AUJ07_07100 [Crenarchaeota archaeon 13_1_40CM_3_53_5]|nr:MAG: hypothetical protein AUJ07_07100 [Crenarchaeota archaeon 13_1_40CM_3_53_5]